MWFVIPSHNGKLFTFQSLHLHINLHGRNISPTAEKKYFHWRRWQLALLTCVNIKYVSYVLICRNRAHKGGGEENKYFLCSLHSWAVQKIRTRRKCGRWDRTISRLLPRICPQSAHCQKNKGWRNVKLYPGLSTKIYKSGCVKLSRCSSLPLVFG